MLRRATAFFVAFCFGIAAFALPISTQTHVCRMTGLSMEAVPQTAGDQAQSPQTAVRPCCAARTIRSAKRAPQTGIGAASCCVVRENTRQSPLPTASVPAPFVAVLPIVPAALPAFPTAVFSAASCPLLRHSIVPRAPPRGFSGLRAPPLS